MGAKRAGQLRTPAAEVKRAVGMENALATTGRPKKSLNRRLDMMMGRALSTVSMNGAADLASDVPAQVGPFKM
jgi:hypothetical protein